MEPLPKVVLEVLALDMLLRKIGDVAYYGCRIARNNRSGRYVSANNRPATYNAIIANCCTRKNCCSCADEAIIPNRHRTFDKTMAILLGNALSAKSVVDTVVMNQYCNLERYGAIITNRDHVITRRIKKNSRTDPTVARMLIDVDTQTSQIFRVLFDISLLV